MFALLLAVVSLSWVQSPSCTPQTPCNYLVHRSVGACISQPSDIREWPLLATLYGEWGSFVDSTAVPGTLYAYEVRVQQANQPLSNATNCYNVVAPAAPAPASKLGAQ